MDFQINFYLCHKHNTMDKKIFISAPQHESKMYCWEQWKEAIESLSYPSDLIEVCLVDNSDTPKNVERIIQDSEIIKAFWLAPKKDEDVFSKIARSHEEARNLFIKSECDYFLHLETDIIPPVDIIERLLSHNKPVVSATYEVGQGDQRKLMIQPIEPFHKNIKAYRSVDYLFNSGEEVTFIDGMVKQVFAIGLGCVLIRRDVAASVPFRRDKNINASADTFWANDLFANNIPVFVDTSTYCKHLNQTWMNRVNELKIEK